MTKEISGLDIDVLRTWSSKNTAHFSSWIIKNYNIPERFKGFSLRWQGIWVKNLRVNRYDLYL